MDEQYPSGLGALRQASWKDWNDLPTQRSVVRGTNGPVESEQLAPPTKEPTLTELLAKHEQEIRHLHEINQHFGALLAEAKQQIQFLRDRMGV